MSYRIVSFLCPERLIALQIKSEQGIASGIRRIEAVAGPSALAFLNERDSVVREMQGQLKVAAAELPSKVSGSVIPPQVQES